MVTVIALLLFMGSALRPYLSLFLILLVLCSTLAVACHQQKKVFLIIWLLNFSAAVLFVLFPVKFIFVPGQENLYRLIPIVYGLPTENTWILIDQGYLYPGGDVVNGIFDPRYVVLVDF